MKLRRVYLVASLLFTLVFFHFSGKTYEEASSVRLLWSRNLADESRVPGPYYNALLFNSQRRTIQTRNGREIHLKNHERAFVPFLGHVIFRYAKVGSRVSCHDTVTGEVRWVREQGAYPVSDHRGRLPLLIAGDNSRVDTLDSSGDLATSFSGMFLTHISFATRTSLGLLAFSEGVAHVLAPGGRRIHTHTIAADVFLKSGALGPAGRFMALHVLEGGNDFIRIFQLQSDGNKIVARKTGEIMLAHVYPHMLHFAVSEHGLLLAAPDFVGFYRPDGSLAWNRVFLRDIGSVYRPVHSDRDFFIYGEADTAFVLDRLGRLVRRIPVDSNTWRALPGMEEHAFAIHSETTLTFFKFIPAFMTTRR